MTEGDKLEPQIWVDKFIPELWLQGANLSEQQKRVVEDWKSSMKAQEWLKRLNSGK